MALYAFDGTWNSAKDNEDPAYENTNVYRFFQAYHRHSTTDDFYVAGVGTRFDLVGRIAGGVFGLGVLARIDEAYAHLCRAWDCGDRVIDIVGFSRGAATTLDFCHRIHTSGIRRPGSDEVVEARPTIRFLGVWDVVAAFGLANLGNTELNIGHHLELPKSSLGYAFHALALDERRPSFLPTRLHGACEVWFRGAHSDIGGGNGNRGLNDITLTWMLRKAMAASLPVTGEDIAALRPDPTASPQAAPKLPAEVRVISAVDRYHYTVTPLDAWTNPPRTCAVETRADEQRAIELGAGGVEVLPMEARRRLLALWETAVAVAARQGFTLDPVRDPLLMLLHGRISLVTDDEELKMAGRAVTLLVTTMIHGAQTRGFHVLAEFFLTEALSRLPRLFPLTD